MAAKRNQQRLHIVCVGEATTSRLVCATFVLEEVHGYGFDLVIGGPDGFLNLLNIANVHPCEDDHEHAIFH